MSAKHVIKFHLITEFFCNYSKQLRRGENAYSSGHVKNMHFSGNVQPAVIRGEVKASMKKKTYSVEITFDLKLGVITASCTCPRGQAVCHHMAALLLQVHYDVSAIDIECEWSHRKPVTEEEVQPVEKMYPSKEQYVAVKSDINEEDIEKFKNSLGQTNVVGFSWLLKMEADEKIHQLVPAIEDILFSEEYVKSDNSIGYLQEKCVLTVQQIHDIASSTVGQHNNESWLIVRKGRLTASKFGMVLNAIKRNKYPPSLYKGLLEGYNLTRALSVQWGKNNEAEARRQFVEYTGLKVIETGLWLHECGFLGASPDGLVDDDAILEIKCPYKFRNAHLKEGVQDGKYFFFYENEQLVVNGDHIYYHQVQRQLYLTGRRVCYFFIWTPQDCELLVIERDPEWESNLDVLKMFYIEKFVPALFDIK